MYFLLNMGIFHCYVMLVYQRVRIPSWTNQDFMNQWQPSLGFGEPKLLPQVLPATIEVLRPRIAEHAVNGGSRPSHFTRKIPRCGERRGTKNMAKKCQHFVLSPQVTKKMFVGRNCRESMWESYNLQLKTGPFVKNHLAPHRFFSIFRRWAQNLVIMETLLENPLFDNHESLNGTLIRKSFWICCGCVVRLNTTGRSIQSWFPMHVTHDIGIKQRKSRLWFQEIVEFAPQRLGEDYRRKK